VDGVVFILWLSVSILAAVVSRSTVRDSRWVVTKCLRSHGSDIYIYIYICFFLPLSLTENYSYGFVRLCNFRKLPIFILVPIEEAPYIPVPTPNHLHMQSIINFNEETWRLLLSHSNVWRGKAVRDLEQKNSFSVTPDSSKPRGPSLGAHSVSSHWVKR
jgi:hypothetical protein